MSWYQSPVQPFDPVVVSQQPKPPIRYVRDNFANTGQNSFVKPPAQDPAQWQALTNVQPILQGILKQRWGYTQFTGLTGTPNRIYNYQSDAIGTRAIIAAGNNNVSSFTEAGLPYNSNIFTPENLSGTIRSITSRNYQYFCDGLNALDTAHRSGDSLKWNGSTTGGVSNIGIVNTDVTINQASGGSSSNTVGPNTGSAASDTGPGFFPWTNPAGIITNNFATAASITLPTGLHSTDNLQLLNFFNSMPGTPVGIQVSITYKTTSAPGVNATFYANLIKNGIVTGTQRGVNLISDGSAHTAVLGSASDLWGASFAPVDLVQSNFGVTFFVSESFNVSPTIQVSYVTITVTLGSSSGTSTNSGTGIGIINSTSGGTINLILGRVYYLVPANNLTGHFGDLSGASSSTGPETNSEITLALATYNDPQVTSKYVLATIDGGDPSILYETQVLAGFQVTSWAIAGNVVTFTGIYPSGIPQYAGSTSVTVGGLIHGNYMNGQTLTVTSSTPTTIVAPFTHANDSATEVGVVGNLTTEIPNSVALVVDNTPDPNLVLKQPLVYTDQFGNTFGVALNSPPPAGNLLVKHQGRLWMAGVAGATHSVFFTKSIAELTLPNGFTAGKYEEAWPASNYFDISDGAESITGFLSDGVTLYIGTQNHIRRLIGNAPANFQLPQIIHPQVGLINQEVWQLVYMQGAPSGSIWMTPDFRVIQSDFNTYLDIGTPIQDILNNLQPTAASLAHAAFVADGEFDLYILSVPYLQSAYCDTHLVFELKTRMWYVWQPTTGSLSLLYNVTQAGIPQWLFINGSGNAIDIYSAIATTDNGVAFPVSATTTWMSLGEPTRRKMLNEVQVYGNTNMTVTITGANNLADFSNPVSVVYSRALKLSPFNTWNLYLTSAKTKHRYYQFTFAANSGPIPFLGSYAISSMPLDDL